MPYERLQCPMGLSIATLLAVLTDSAANLLQPGVREPSDRFKVFLKHNYPWAEDQPFGLESADAIDLLWEVVRTPAVHRLGLQPDSIFSVRYVVLFHPTDEGMSEIELSEERPTSEPTIKFDGTQLTILLEGWYWGLRKAIVKAVDTRAKSDAIAKHIRSGDFARTDPLFKLLKAQVSRPKKPKPKG